MPEYSDQIIAYDLNNELKEDYGLKEVSGKNIKIFPMVAPSAQKPPFVVYYWIPGHIESSSFAISEDTVRYIVYDSDADRCFRMSNKIISMFDVMGIIIF